MIVSGDAWRACYRALVDNDWLRPESSRGVIYNVGEEPERRLEMDRSLVEFVVVHKASEEKDEHGKPVRKESLVLRGKCGADGFMEGPSPSALDILRLNEEVVKETAGIPTAELEVRFARTPFSA